MTVKRNGVLVVDTDDCPKCSCNSCNHKCYEREAMDLHTREMGLEYMRTLDINND